MPEWRGNHRSNLPNAAITTTTGPRPLLSTGIACKHGLWTPEAKDNGGHRTFMSVARPRRDCCRGGKLRCRSSGQKAFHWTRGAVLYRNSKRRVDLEGKVISFQQSCFWWVGSGWCADYTSRPRVVKALRSAEVEGAKAALIGLLVLRN